MKTQRLATMLLTLVLLLQGSVVPALAQLPPNGETPSGLTSTYTISGRVTDADGDPIPNVTVTASLLDTSNPPLLVVHGIQVLSLDGFNCNQNVGPLESTGSTLGELPVWFQDNYTVWIAHLTSSVLYTPSIQSNADCLKDQVVDVYAASGNQKVTIIAHSMGGLVTRACLGMPDCRDKVKSVYTLGTPHAGLNMGIVGKILIKLAEGYIKAHGLPIPLETGICLWQGPLCQMSTDEMLGFNLNPAHHNQSTVESYTFIGGDATPWWTGWLVSVTDGKNDGIVGSSSAVGWVYPFGTPLPTDWTVSKSPERYWTDEVHFNGFEGDAYYMSRSGAKSQAFECIAYKEGFGGATQPSSCRTASTSSVMASEVPALPQTTQTIEGIVGTGEIVAHTLDIDSSGRTLFTLASTEGNLRFTLVRPDNQLITPEYASANPTEVAYQSMSTGADLPPVATYLFTDTLPGVWQLTVDGANLVTSTPAAYIGFAALGSGVDFDVTKNVGSYDVGETAVFTATLTNGAGISGATVSLALQRPDGVTDIVLLTDAGGGIYIGSYVVPNAGGRVFMTAIATGVSSGTSFSRQVEDIWTIIPPHAQFLSGTTDRGLDEDGDGAFDQLIVTAQISVTQPASYTLSGLLSRSGTAIVSSALYTEIHSSSGIYAVDLAFDGRQIYEAGLDGPYQVENVTLTDVTIGDVVVASNPQIHETAGYRATDFGMDSTSGDSIYLPLLRGGGGSVIRSFQQRTDYTITTDENGYYTLSDLPSGTYKVTTKLTGWSFTPAERIATVSPSVSEVNFTGHTLPADGLVAYWSFDDGTATDSSGSGNNGTVVGDVSVVNGVHNAAFSFDGSGDYILIPQSASLGNLEQTTISYWVKYHKSTSGVNDVSTTISNGPDQAELGFFTYAESTEIIHHLGQHNNAVRVAVPISATVPLEEQEYIFVAFVVDGVDLRIYKNGQLEQRADRQGLPISRPSEDWYIGAQRTEDPFAYFLNGSMDEVRIYNRALTEDEILALYTHPSP